MRNWVHELTLAASVDEPEERKQRVERLLSAFEEDVLRRRQESEREQEVDLLASTEKVSRNEAAISAALALEASSREDVQEARRDIYDRLAQSSGEEWITPELLHEAARFVLPIHTPAFTRSRFLEKFVVKMEDESEAAEDIWWRDPYDGRLVGPHRTGNGLLKLLSALSKKLAPEFGWDVGSTFTFVATGHAPASCLLGARLDAGTSACSTHLVLRVNLALDGKQLESAYRDIRANLLDGKHPRSASEEVMHKIERLGDFAGPMSGLFAHPVIGEALMRFGAMNVPDYGAVRSSRVVLGPKVKAAAFRRLQKAKSKRGEALRRFYNRLELLIDARLKEQSTSHREETELTLPNVFAALGCDPSALPLWDHVTMPLGWSLWEAEEQCSILSKAYEADDLGPYLNLSLRCPIVDAWTAAYGKEAVIRDLSIDWKANSVITIEFLSATIARASKVADMLSIYESKAL